MTNGPGADPGILVTGFFVASCIYLSPPHGGGRRGEIFDFQDSTLQEIALLTVSDTKITITYMIMRVENKQIH